MLKYRDTQWCQTDFLRINTKLNNLTNVEFIRAARSVNKVLFSFLELYLFLILVLIGYFCGKLAFLVIFNISDLPAIILFLQNKFLFVYLFVFFLFCVF